MKLKEKTGMKFKNSYDRTALAATSAAALAIYAFALVTIIENAPSYTTVTLCLAILLPLIFSPADYEITEKNLVIHRLIKNIKIDRSGISSVFPAENNFDRGRSILGSRGFFGWYGTFRSASLGKYRLCGRKRENYVIVLSKSGNYVFTPDDKDAFVSALLNRGEN